jgi:hypothetical protein
LDTTGLGPSFTQYSTQDILPHPGLVAYWPLNEPAGSTTANDLAGQMAGTPHNGTYESKDTNPSLFPIPAFSADPSTQSAAAPGDLALGTPGIVTGDWVQTGGDNDTPGTQATAMEADGGFAIVAPATAINPAIFSVEAWVLPEWNASDPPAFHVFIDSRNFGLPAPTGFAVWASEANNWEARLGLGAGGFLTVTGPPVTLATAAYVVLTFDGAVARISVNGVQTTPDVPVPAGGAFAPNTDTPLVIGVGGPWLPDRTQPTDQFFFPCFPFNGKIQDVAIYKIALTAADIEQHFINGNGLGS